MGIVHSYNDTCRKAARAIIKILGNQFWDEEDAIAVRIQEHCFPDEYAEQIRLRREEDEQYNK